MCLPQFFMMKQWQDSNLITKVKLFLTTMYYISKLKIVQCSHDLFVSVFQFTSGEITFLAVRSKSFDPMHLRRDTDSDLARHLFAGIFGNLVPCWGSFLIFPFERR